MRLAKSIGTVSAAWLCALACGAPVALAQDAAPTRAIVAVPYNQSATVQLAVTTDRSVLKIGETVTICFQASRAGFATLWNVATDGTVGRIFPTAFQPAGPDTMRVEGGKQVCAGQGGDAFRFRVDGPPGMEDLYLLWTARADMQPPTGTYPDADAFVADLKPLGAAQGGQWGTAKTTYDIVPVTGPVAPPMAAPAGQGALSGAVAPPPLPVAPTPAPPRPAPAPAPAPPPPATASADKGRILILSVGANVKPLTKTNQDASIFAEAVSEMFSVPKEDIRLLKDVQKGDFVAGLDWLRQRARPQDLVFIYYSGHGAQVRDPTGTSADGLDEAFVPYDFEVKPERQRSAKDLLWSQEFARLINAIPTDNVITVADACHSAGLYRSLEGAVVGAKSKFLVLPADMDMSPPDGLVQAPATRAAAGAGRIKAKGLLLAAARRDQSALEGSDGGVFTMALLRKMVKAKDGTLQEIFKSTAADVDKATKGRQSPQAVGDTGPATLLSFRP